MASQLYQVIEGLSRDKGIDPQIVVTRRRGRDRPGDAQVLQDAGEHARRAGQRDGRDPRLCLQDRRRRPTTRLKTT